MVLPGSHETVVPETMSEPGVRGWPGLNPRMTALTLTLGSREFLTSALSGQSFPAQVPCSGVRHRVGRVERRPTAVQDRHAQSR